VQLITSNISQVRARFRGLHRQMPAVAQNTVRALGQSRFRTVAREALGRVATETTLQYVDLFVETVVARAIEKGIRVTMNVPQAAIELRRARTLQLSGRKNLAVVPEDLQRMRDAVRTWVLTEKNLDPAEQADPRLAVARVWHILGIHPDSTATSRDRQFAIGADGRVILNPWGNPERAAGGGYEATADLDRGARRLLDSDTPDALPAFLAAQGINGLEPAEVTAWFTAVLTAWVADVRARLPALFAREVRKAWRQAGGRA
jgi:hypothetical protein